MKNSSKNDIKKKENKNYEVNSGNNGGNINKKIVSRVILWVSLLVAALASVASNWETLKEKGYIWWDRPPPPPPFSLDTRILNNDVDVCFELRPNGDGKSPNVGIKVCSKNYRDVDDLLEKTCPQITSKDLQSCQGSNGARLITSTGIRVMSFADIEKDEFVYVVPQSEHFLWPLVKVGNVIFPRSLESPVKGKPVRLVQLSDSPRVFQIDNFVSQDEIDQILEKNRNRVAPSEVGFAGWKDNTRTSSTSWDFTSPAAKTLQARAFDLLGMDRDPALADALQVLRYDEGQWYKPHTDYFNEKGFDGHDPTVNNGTNRFATVFVYFSNVEEGGHTVFPHSTTHAGYNGEKLVHDGTINTPGYIDTKDAYWCCNTSSTALRSPSIKGNAVLFYSQLPGGKLDPASLHGGCPPLKGTKWSGNIWIWTRPKPDKSKAKDADQKKEKEKGDNGFDIHFLNEHDFDIEIFWDPNFGEEGKQEMVKQYDLAPKERKPVHTFPGHMFVVYKKNTQEKLSTYEAKKSDEGSAIRFSK